MSNEDQGFTFIDRVLTSELMIMLMILVIHCLGLAIGSMIAWFIDRLISIRSKFSYVKL